MSSASFRTLIAAALLAASLAAPAAAATVDGLFDVGGHKLFARCMGSGGPTIVYLHGDGGSIYSEQGLSVMLSPKHRFCAYSRANRDESETVPGPVTGEMIVTDLHNLLASLGEKPPYLLLGASLGGLVAYQYLMTYPDEVVGMLLLDASFPDELSIEQYYPEADQLTHEMWKESPELLDYLEFYEAAFALRGKEPKIPVTYLLATPTDQWQGISAEYDAKVFDAMNAYVASFSPGVIKKVLSAHWMENSNALAVVHALEELIAGLPSR